MSLLDTNTNPESKNPESSSPEAMWNPQSMSTYLQILKLPILDPKSRLFTKMNVVQIFGYKYLQFT